MAPWRLDQVAANKLVYVFPMKWSMSVAEGECQSNGNKLGETENEMLIVGEERAFKV